MEGNQTSSPESTKNYPGQSIQAGKRSSKSITKRSCSTGPSDKHKRPISSEDLEVLYAATDQLGLNPPESFANSA